MIIGVWQLVLIVAAVCYLVLPIALANRTKRLERRHYALRSIAIMVVFVAGSFMVDTENTALILTGAFGVLAGLPLLLIWSVHRTQDAGLSKWLNFLQLIPLVGLGFWVFLLIRKSKDVPEEAIVDIFD